MVGNNLPYTEIELFLGILGMHNDQVLYQLCYFSNLRLDQDFGIYNVDRIAMSRG